MCDSVINLYKYNAFKSGTLQLTRGKNDQIDSYRIAKYALRFKDKSVLWTPSNEYLEKAKHLFALRERLQKSIKQLTVPLNEFRNIIDKKFHNKLK